MADVVYHKRDLYKDVTARILAEFETGAAPLKPNSYSVPNVVPSVTSIARLGIGSG